VRETHDSLTAPPPVGPGHAERRQTPRGAPGFEPTRAQLVSTTLGSYEEMPGLSLFLPQAARLFGVSVRTCQVVLDDLVKERRLGRDGRGQYVRQLDRELLRRPRLYR
jgi:hypothetical protein